MEEMTAMPMFRLGSEEFGDVPLGYAVSADCLFVDTEDPDPATISFTGLTRVPAEIGSGPRARQFEFLDVDVISSTGRKLGHYDLGSAAVRFDGGADNDPVAVLEGAQPISLPGGLALWQRWCDDSTPLAPGEWIQLSANHRHSWLRIARSVWGVNGYSDLPGGRTEQVSLDGHLVKDETSLYLALGETIAGPGGYVGWGLDALDDCLAALPSDRIELTWDHFAASRDALGTEHLAEVLEILAERDVSVIFEG